MPISSVLRLMLAASFLAPIVDLDWRVQRAVQEWRPDALERPMEIATGLGRPQVVLGVFLIVAAFGGPGGVEVARYAIVAMVPTNLAVEGLKRATFRTRPDGERKRSNASLPSSHAANAFALACILARKWKRGSVYLYLLAALVAFSRIYLNRHFLSDVVVGAAIGVAGGWMAGPILAKLPPADRSAARSARTS